MDSDSMNNNSECVECSAFGGVTRGSDIG